MVGNNTALEIKNGNGHAIVIKANNGDKILQLEDNGLLRSRKIKVGADTWADYVFKQGYKLKSLSETELYIKEHGHLPGVPSEKEINKNGLDIAEMQKIQMEKIEELYLHLIEMEKKVEDLENQNVILKEELKKIK